MAEEKGNKRKMSKLSEKAFSPPWDLGCFLWNCDCSIWQKEPIWNFGFFSQFQFQVLVGVGERFMQSLGHKGDNGGIQVASEMSQIFSLLLIWVKTDWTQPVFCRKRNIPCSINRAPPSHTYNQQKSKHFQRKMRAAISKMITKVRSFVDKAGI